MTDTVDYSGVINMKEGDPDDGSHLIPEISDEAEIEYPEGGLKAWSVVFGCFCGLFVCLLPMNSLGTFQSYIQTHQLATYDLDKVGWIFSIYSFISLFLSAQIGPLFDTFGPRILNFVGSILLLLQMSLLGVCSNYGEFLFVYGILGGLGCSILLTSCVSSVSHYFNINRGYATGLALSGGSLGGVFGPLVFEALIEKLSFGWTTRCLALVDLVLLIFTNLLVTSRLNKKVNFKLKNIMLDPTLYLNMSLTLVCWALFFTDGALFVPLSYISSYSLDNGINQTTSYQMLAFLNVGSVFGRLIPGFLSDKVGRFNMMICAQLLCIITVFAIWLNADGRESVTIVFAVMFGFASGSNISLTPVCLGQLCDVRDYGRYYSSGMAIASLGALISNPISGKIVDASNGGYTGLICFTGALYTVAVSLLLVARWKIVGMKPSTIY